MTDREKIVSNDYYDLITDFVLPGGVSGNLRDAVYQPVSGEIGISYVNQNDVPPMSVSNFTYPIIPSLYGLMQIAESFDPTPLIHSGITQIQGSALALTGRGVVIGFLDTGIRYEEEVFRNEDGSTRILGIWDQTIQTGQPPAGILYGTEYQREQINEALQSENPRQIVPSYDEIGHGTALASVAAGSSLRNGLGFLGAAPQADIVMVKLRQAKQHLREFYLVDENVPAYAESDVMVAIKYLESYAVSLNRPLIICMGIGTSMGDHEGHSTLATYLNQIATRRSRVVIVCGGNEGNSAHHYVGTSIEGLRETVDNVEIRVDGTQIGFTAELWGSVPARHSIAIRSPGGEITPTVDFREQESRRFTFIYERTTIEVDHILVEQGSGEELIFFRFIAPTPGIWTIQVTISESNGESSFHIWLPLTQFLQSNTYFLRPSPYITLTEPANIREVISVTTYNDVNGSFWAESGRGFTRLGRIKPDICAPGVNISTILGKRTGSSMAAALTAGAAALFMEWAVVRGNQTRVESRELKNYLIRGADRSTEIDYPSREWGYGKLDLAGTFDVLAGV
ncbi:MAG: S8 family peptidase [Bacillota bacterium]|nr:S8 family peptidase [Bacillota bacterium]